MARRDGRVVEGGGLENRFPVIRNGGSNPSPSATIAFLRGINVGGHHKIPMPALRKAFEAMGFKNVRTVLASGNVVFETTGKKAEDLEGTIARGLAGAFGFPVPVLLRSMRELAALVAADPFKGLAPSADTKLYVTFLPRDRPGASGATTARTSQRRPHRQRPAGRGLQHRGAFRRRRNPRAHGLPREVAGKGRHDPELADRPQDDRVRQF